ncbi:transketolase family protein [Amphibacillus jilinensis]|uniref:transketolase family protein n=1 Tax=Amphibacillus jilinensis TaxID=1216008 RepID=UPI0002D4398C|nr:transketolase C-terminal domain-containing protein [Amphibacillus jilinensis]
MNKIANRQIMCETLLEQAKKNNDLLVLTSDSRGSASLLPFAEQLPTQLIETGIAEQNIVGMAAGLAHSGKRPFVASPACFLSMRSIEQIKVDVAYSNTNVKLIGISGGVSYGALGMSHHSLQDIAVTRAIPNLEVIIPADRFETKAVFNYLAESDKPAYVRLGRNPVEDCYSEELTSFEVGKAVTMQDGRDLTLIATGETVRVALDAALALEQQGLSVRVLNIHTIKPLDQQAIIKAAQETKLVMTLEEHSIYSGLGAAVAEVISAIPQSAPVKILGIADEPAITGKTKEIFEHYGLSVENIKQIVTDYFRKNG